jgi:hypothetical protein
MVSTWGLKFIVSSGPSQRRRNLFDEKIIKAELFGHGDVIRSDNRK